ncbi:P-loop ATPase, Sll1717 family [Burkholderia pseudomallei]|uniref:P-loop ATPase, Sll1717 family n=2 Tax=Burkholderia pseudomallei TaxID=28450 RepID=UPI000A57AD34|nr:hypothetical protein [Burkholderia pseudomallei]
MADFKLLLKYVRTGTAEGDRKFLDQIFVTPSEFENLIGIEPGGMRILVGNKGIGKSAIVEWIDKISTKRNMPCVLIRPDNISTKDLPVAQDIGSLKRFYYDVLLRSVGAQIGTQLKGLLKGNAARLHNEARQAGLLEDDFIQKSLALISAVSMPVSKINGVQLAKELSGVNSATQLVGAINTQLLSSGSLFFLLIDDTDQLAAPDQPAHLNRIWALLLAVRRLVGECDSVRAIVTLRSGVWTRLTSESQGQRDQTDHLRGLVVPIHADDKLMHSIIRRRLEQAAKDAGKARVDPYAVFFNGSTVTLPSSTEKRSWVSFITKSARERPRDAIQLIKNMADYAVKNGAQLIGSGEADEGMKIYSGERVDDIVNEFSLDCSNIREVINSFSDLSFESGFEELRGHLGKVPSIASIVIRGSVMHPQNDDDSIVILALLHETGFLNPRVADKRQVRGFRHILFQENPNFVKLSNWNEMQAATWEVHPAFRSYLLGVRQAQAARVQNALKAPPKGGS